MANLQNQQSIENGNANEEHPLNRLNSRNDPNKVERIRCIFNEYDRDNDGYLNIKELKNLIKSHGCDSLPKGLARNLMKMGDEDNNGVLSFDEFYKLSIQNDWLIKGYVARYCKLVVPSPHRGTAFDEPDGQYESSMSCWPPPITMVIFSIIEIIMFLYDVFYLEDHRDKKFSTIGYSTKGPAAAFFIYNPYKRQEVWRFITYMFVHVGVMHLFMNLLVQIFLGTALELVHCWWRVALIYLAGVFAGSMGTSVADPRIYLAGASGGVYALITAHIATIIINWKEMEYAVIQLFIFLIFCGVDLGTSIFNHLNNTNDQIGYVAHLSGAIAGLLVGIGVLRNLNVRSWEKKLWWVAVTIYFAIMIIFIFIHLFMPSHFPTPKSY